MWEELVELFQVTGGDSCLPRKGGLHDRESAVDRVDFFAYLVVAGLDLVDFFVGAE